MRGLAACKILGAGLVTGFVLVGPAAADAGAAPLVGRAALQSASAETCGWTAPEFSEDSSPATLAGAADGTSWLVSTNELDRITTLQRVGGQWKATPDVLDYQAPNNLYRPTVNGVAAVSGGGVWVAASTPEIDADGNATSTTTETHLWDFADGEFHDVTPPALIGLAGSFPTALAATSGDNVWLAAATSDSQPLLYHWDGSVWTDLSAQLSGLDGPVGMIAPLSQGTAFAATRNSTEPGRIISPSGYQAVPAPTVPAGYVALDFNAITVAPDGSVWAAAFGDLADGSQTPFAASFDVADQDWSLTPLPYPALTPTADNPPGTVGLTIAAASASDVWIGGQTTAQLNQPDTPRTWHFDGTAWSEGDPEPQGDSASGGITDPTVGTPLVLTLPYYAGGDRTIDVSPATCSATTPPADMPEVSLPVALLAVGAATGAGLVRRRRTTRS